MPTFAPNVQGLLAALAVVTLDLVMAQVVLDCTARPAQAATVEQPGAATGSTTTVPFAVPSTASIPKDELGASIERGRQYLEKTKEQLPDYVGNGLNCKSCHLNVGTVKNAIPWVGVAATFPQYRSRDGRVNILEQRINDCFERSMNGKSLPLNDPAMIDMVAYMTWLSQNVPIGRTVEGMGVPKVAVEREPDLDKGKAVYAAKCAACHGADGQGMKTGDAYQFPPLWGADSFNIGAGMARLYTAAGFVKYNMPLAQGGTLSDEDAWDVAAYFTRQERPDFPGKVNDWPKGGRPKDARY